MILRSIIVFIMPKVSRIKLDSQRQKIVIDRLWSSVTLIENKEETIKFLKDLLTPIEQIMIAKRLTAALMLRQGYNYQQIAAYLKTTPGTIASVNRSLNFGNNGYFTILQRVYKVELEKQNNIEKMGEIKVWRTPIMDTAFEAAKAVGKQVKKRRKRESL